MKLFLAGNSSPERFERDTGHDDFQKRRPSSAAVAATITGSRERHSTVESWVELWSTQLVKELTSSGWE